MPHARKLNRRDFLRVAATAATGALIAACAPATREAAPVVEEAPAQPAATNVPTATRVPPTVAPTATMVPPAATPTEEAVDTFIAKVADVPPDSAFDFEWNGKPAIVVNLEGEYNAFRNVCTHNGCPTKYYGGTAKLNCPCHGSQFDAVTGEVLQGPAETKLRRIEVVIEGDSIYVVV